MMYVIPGDPIPWKTHKGFGKRSYSPNYQEKRVAATYLSLQHGAKPLYDTPLKVFFRFEMNIPERLKKKYEKRLKEGEVIFPITRPDRTNLQKFAEDCLIGTVIKDDNIVVDGRSIKIYSLEPKTIIVIEEIV